MNECTTKLTRQEGLLQTGQLDPLRNRNAKDYEQKNTETTGEWQMQLGTEERTRKGQHGKVKTPVC